MQLSEETIDHQSITDSVADLHFNNGFTYSDGLRKTMIFAGLIGLFFIAYNVFGDKINWLGYLAGPIFILAAIYTLTSTNGTEISLSNNYIRAYTKSFGIQKGKWTSSLYHTDLCLLKKGISVSYAPSAKDQPQKNAYELFLMTPDHRKRIYLTDFDTKEEAIAAITNLANKMKKKRAIYAPKISQATQALRYDRH